MSSPIFNAIRAESAGFGETNDCVVVAFCAATGISYAEAHAIHKAGGRRPRRGMYREDCRKGPGYLPLWKRHGLILGDAIKGAPKTTGSLLNDRRLRSGVWIVHTRTHVLCVADGEVMDWTSNRKYRVTSVHPVLDPDNIPPPKPSLAQVAERYFTTGEK